jgi:lysophospholipase L1-like esterase
MIMLPAVMLTLCGLLGAGPSPGEHRANVPITIEDNAWMLHTPPSHVGPVELRFVDKPASATEVATGKALPFKYDAGTAIIDPPVPLKPDDNVIAVSWKNDRYDKDMESFAEHDRQQPPKQGGILFVGSSTIRIWKLEESFPGLNPLNRGFGGSKYADAVHYFDRVILPYRPATVVIYDGDNDIAGGKSPEWVFADFEALMRRIRFDLPQTRVLILSIKPCPARWSLWDKMQRVNAMVREYASKQERMFFVDITAAMFGPDGKPRADLFEKDGLHLNAQGYGLCAALVKPLLQAAGR